MIKEFKKQVKIETVEEFLARGGKIQTEVKRDDPGEPDLIQLISDSEIKKFYNSKEWKELRNNAYKQLTHFCPICGTEEKLVVDHINPVRFFWEQRLDIDNLQILCDECNLEKGSMVGWSIEYHLKNQSELQRIKLQKTLRIEESIHRKEKKRATEGLSVKEQDNLQRAYSAYRSRCFNAKILPITKFDFRKYMEENYSKFLWSNFEGVKGYIKNHFHEIRPPEKILVPLSSG